MQILYDFCTYFRFIFFVDFYVFFSFILHSNYYYTFCNKINTTIHFNRKLYRFIYFLSFIVNYGLYSVDSFATVNGFQLIFWHFSPIRFSLKIFSSFIFNWNNQQQQNNRFYTNSYVHLHIWWPKTFVFCHFIEIHCKISILAYYRKFWPEWNWYDLIYNCATECYHFSIAMLRCFANNPFLHHFQPKSIF